MLISSVSINSSKSPLRAFGSLDSSFIRIFSFSFFEVEELAKDVNNSGLLESKLKQILQIIQK